MIADSVQIAILTITLDVAPHPTSSKMKHIHHFSNGKPSLNDLPDTYVTQDALTESESSFHLTLGNLSAYHPQQSRSTPSILRTFQRVAMCFLFLEIQFRITPILIKSLTPLCIISTGFSGALGNRETSCFWYDLRVRSLTDSVLPKIGRVAK